MEEQNIERQDREERAETTDQPENAEQVEHVETYAELCAKYGDPRKSRRSFSGNGQLTRCSLACAIISTVAVALLSLLTFVSYARLVTVIGGNTYSENNYGIFTFIIKCIDEIKTWVIAISEGSMEEILGTTTVVRTAINIIFAFIIIIICIVRIIRSGLHFYRRKPYKIPHELFSVMRWGVAASVLQSFYCTVSGGEGKAFYSYGYSMGIGMITGMAIGACSFIACAVLYAMEHKDDFKSRLRELITTCVNLVFSAALCGVLAYMPMSSTVTYALSSSLVTVVISIIQHTFSFSGLGFTIFNLIIFICGIWIYKNVTTVLQKEGDALFTFADMPVPIEVDSKKKKRKKSRSRIIKTATLTSAVLGALGILSFCLLKIPAIGLGWSVQLLPYFITITVLSAVQFTFLMVFDRISKSKSKPQEELSVA